jgi:hypothetical protein
MSAEVIHRDLIPTCSNWDSSLCGAATCAVSTAINIVPQVGIMYRLSKGRRGKPGHDWLAGCVGPAGVE